MENITNNGCTRCKECGYVYESTEQSCPRCGKANGSLVLEDKMVICESNEPVFNIND